ncbi:Frequency clock protein [Fusarium oxysporum f. sp. raphani]|uniref:Frequency clock protein n=1 Tax=Fusarium oxysporum f. sp. raphani TaxID=96318 RepID=A0A8J5NHR6_FUSOX|nr:Frequency clock protein [Fusarium oxysporum f. sp. raphani]
MPLNQDSSHRSSPPNDHPLLRNSPTGSYKSRPSELSKWFNSPSNNAITTTDNNIIEINTPFLREESGLTHIEGPCSHNQYQLALPMLTMTHSNSADDYRSIIDDLSLEIQQLKKVLKHRKKSGPAMLHKDRLFEIKIQGLPPLKKRELEAILRDFATDLEESPDASWQKKKTASPHSCDHIYSKYSIGHKHAPSSPGTDLRPTDSAYASLSASAGPSSTPLSLPIMSSTQSSNSKVEDYLRDVPDGLYPQQIIMTDKERKSLVVRRLEQLFTGGTNGVDISKVPLVRPGGSFVITHDIRDTQMADLSVTYELFTHKTQPIQEARNPALEQQARPQGNKCHPGGCGSVTDPNADDIEAGGNNGGLTSNMKLPPLILPLPEQRPMRLCDLDPDRAHISSESMNYIRHLSRLPPYSPEQQSIQRVYLDTEGWVYLSLLYNLAQIHLISVTVDFVRSSISEGSTKLQLSPDGHKVRLRGRFIDKKFSSCSSSYDSQAGAFTDDIVGSEKKRKRQRTERFTANESQSGGSSKDMPQFDPQFCARVESFRYKPLFAQQNSSARHTLRDMSVYSFTAVDDDNLGEVCLGLNYSEESADRSQHHVGAISYYSGVPFCIDLSGDPATIPSTIGMPSSSLSQNDSQQLPDFARSPRRTASGSFISYRPLTGRCQDLRRQTSSMKENNNEVQGLINDDREQSSDIELDLIWNDAQQDMGQQPLVPCGLGGVLPDDHFTVVVDTKRPKQDVLPWASEIQTGRSNESIERIIRRRAAMLTSCPVPSDSEAKAIEAPPPVEIEYFSWRMERLIPVPLPSPANFFPPFSTDNSTSDEDDDPSRCR